MKRHQYRGLRRFAAAIVGHAFLFTRYRDLFMWGGRSAEAWEVFWTGSAAAITLVFSVSLIIHGKAEEKVGGLVLSVLPSYCLYAVFWNYVQLVRQ